MPLLQTFGNASRRGFFPGTVAKLQTVFVYTQTSPYLQAYNWLGTAFGTKYSNPATLPNISGPEVDVTPLGDAVAVAQGNTVAIAAWPWTSSGFGTRYSAPASVATRGFSLKFNPAGNLVSVVSNASPLLATYPWSSSGFGTKYTDPASPPGGGAQSVDWNPAGNAIVAAPLNGNPPTAYSWSGGYGTNYNAAAVGVTTNKVAFHPAGTYIGGAIQNTTPGYSRWPWNNPGFGSIAMPASYPNGNGTSVKFSPTGSIFLAGYDSSPYVVAYNFTTTFGSQLAAPPTAPGSNVTQIAFNKTGDSVFLAGGSAPASVSAYPWSSSGFGTKYANPSTAIVGFGNGVAVS